MVGASNGCGFEESSLMKMIDDLETTVGKIDSEMADLTKGELAQHLQSKSTAFLSKIQQIEADVSNFLHHIYFTRFPMY